MAGVDFVFNIARGRIREFYRSVDTDTPTGCRLAVVVLATSGIEADSTLRDYDELAALLAGTSNEVTNTNYARKFLLDADLAEEPAPDDTNERYDLDLPDLLYTPGPAAGDGWGKALICFKPASGSADSAIIPLTAHAITVTPDGNDVTLVPAAAGFWRSN